MIVEELLHPDVSGRLSLLISKSMSKARVHCSASRSEATSTPTCMPSFEAGWCFGRTLLIVLSS
jgi:hypothetical protein